jgi:hypothetical protein
MMGKSSPLTESMIVFKQLAIPLVAVIAVMHTGMTFYHNGFSEECPFCRSGKSDVEKMSGETIIIDRDVTVNYYPQTEHSEITPFHYVEDFESRAPPV